MKNHNTETEVVEAGNSFNISADQISIHPNLANAFDASVMDELIQHSFTFQVISSISETIVFPVIVKKGMKKKKHYYIVGLVPFFSMLGRKGQKEFRVTIVPEPSELGMVIGNTYQLMPLKRGNVANAILAALVDHTNNSSEVRQSGMNFIEMENYNRNKKFKDPLETMTGFKMRGILQTLRKETFPESVVNLLKELGIYIKKDVSPEDVEKQKSSD